MRNKKPSDSNNAKNNILEMALVPTLASIVVLIISFIFSKYYIAGDQKVYNEVYYFVRTLSFTDGYEYYCSKLSSIEVIHYAYIYAAAGFFDKDVAMALVNAAVAYSGVFLLLKNGCSKWVSIIIVITNFYLFVLYFAAERLKFGVLFYFLSLTVARFKILRLIFEIISVLGHIQMVAIILPIRLYCFLDSRSFSKKSIILIFISFLFLVLLSLTFQDQLNPYLEKKVGHYSEVTTSLIGCLKLLIFLAVSSIKSKQNWIPRVLAYGVLMSFVLVVGGDRLVIFGFGFCVFLLTKLNQGVNPYLLVLNIYFFSKTIDFISAFITTGQGFDES